MEKSFRFYVIAVLLGGLLAFSAFTGGLTLLDLAGKLPPPPISNRFSLDEKLKFIRERLPVNPTLLAVGSSQTLNQFDGAVLRDMYGPEVRPLNGSAWGFGVDKFGFLVEFYLSSIESVEHVVTITSLPDFSKCTVGNSRFFNIEDATDYAFRGASVYPYYFSYFDPLGLLRMAFFRDYDRLPLKYIDEFGSIAKQPGRNLRISPYLHELDESCFANLRDMATILATRDVAFTVVLAPLKPAYVAEFDPDGDLRSRFFSGVENALVDTGARLINANKGMEFRDEDFWDSTHLYWESASRLTYEVALRVGPDGRGPGGSVETTADTPADVPDAQTN